MRLCVANSPGCTTIEANQPRHEVRSCPANQPGHNNPGAASNAIVVNPTTTRTTYCVSHSIYGAGQEDRVTPAVGVHRGRREPIQKGPTSVSGTMSMTNRCIRARAAVRAPSLVRGVLAKAVLPAAALLAAAALPSSARAQETATPTPQATPEQAQPGVTAE